MIVFFFFVCCRFQHHIHVDVALDSNAFIAQQVDYYMDRFLPAKRAKDEQRLRNKVARDNDDDDDDEAGDGPPLPIDVVWHTHQLFWHRYAADCVALFGHTLGHVPKQRKLCGKLVATSTTSVPPTIATTTATAIRIAHMEDDIDFHCVVQSGGSMFASTLGFDNVDADEDGFNGLSLQDWILQDCLQMLCEDIAAVSCFHACTLPFQWITFREFRILNKPKRLNSISKNIKICSLHRHWHCNWIC
jgi:hypothetical protein